jgi:hypothetical protein
VTYTAHGLWSNFFAYFSNFGQHVKNGIDNISNPNL